MSAKRASLLKRLLTRSVGSNAEGNESKNKLASGNQLTIALQPAVRLEAESGEWSSVIAEAAKFAALGRYPEALAIISRALATAPAHAELLCARASTLFNWGRYHEALLSYVQAEALGIDNAILYLQMGWTQYHLGNVESAEVYMRKAVALDPDECRTQFCLGFVLDARGQFSEAEANYDRAIESRPLEFDFLIGRGNARCHNGDAVLAEADFRAALTARPDSASAWTNLGTALTRQGRDDEALSAFERAETLEIENGEVTSNLPNLVISLRDAERTSEAIELSARRLALRPSSDAYYVLAVSLLTAGRLREGWDAHECRFAREPTLSRRKRYNRPIWSGQGLQNKTILVCSEQGVGDTIQFARYLPMLKALGARVLFMAYEGLEEFSRTFPGVDAVLEIGPLPQFDYYAYLMSLPRIFQTSLTTIPADIPYLHAGAGGRVESWKARFGNASRLKVGIVWAGNPDHQKDNERSLSLSSLLPLWEVEGVEFFALQKGKAESEIASLPTHATIENLGPSLNDYCETAAALTQLDLLITVDTSVAHLAGALGKPVWLLLPKPSDWRWLEQREDTPWYPTMRLFRQTQQRVWGDVVDRVKEALRIRVGVQAPAERGTLSAANTSAVRVAQTTLAGAPLPWKAGLASFVEMRHGMLQYLPDHGVEGESIGWYGEYLQPQLELLGRMTKPGSIMLEADAGVGAHSLHLARSLGASGHLFLCEPRPIVQRILRQNLGANKIGNVTVLRHSVGRMSKIDQSAGERRSVGDDTQPGAASGTKTETIDELQLEQLHWLKINDNICATDVLDGASETLWRLRPMLFISAHNAQGLKLAQARAEQFSYHCWRIDTPLFNADNYNVRHDDIFDGRSVSALLAIPEEIEVDIPLDGCVELSSVGE
jgi:FkbM family methyltransferase